MDTEIIGINVGALKNPETETYDLLKGAEEIIEMDEPVEKEEINVFHNYYGEEVWHAYGRMQR